jgi:hypothetical protein
LYYRDPAYPLTGDLRRSAKRLLHIYFDRWRIEVNHREEKDTLGVGQAQLWNEKSVPKQPVLAVAADSALRWHPYRRLARNVAALMQNFQSGGATLDARPAWICLRYYAKRRWRNRSCTRH